MKSDEHEVKQAVKHVGELFTPQVALKAVEMANKVIQKGIPLKEAFGYSDGQVDAVYAQAYRLYNTGKYQDAIHLFRVLAILDPVEAKYTLGLAACFHMLKEYENAIQLYMVAGIMDGDSPIPHFHVSDCYIQMNDRASAILSLDMAIKRAGNKPEYQILKDRALLTIESLKKEIIQLGEKS